jgi:hypothetical protein
MANITIKTMAFGNDANTTMLRQLATVGGGEFSEAVSARTFDSCLEKEILFI